MVTVAAIAIGVGVVYLGWVCGDRKNGERRFTSHNSRRNAISKKEADYAVSMHRLEDEQDALDSRDFGEAYNFHMDCGDR